MRRSVVLLLLAQVATVICTHDEKLATGNNNNPKLGDTKGLDDAGSQTKLDVVSDRAEAPIPQPGADLVDEALAHLNQIPQTSHRKRHKPASLVGRLFDLALSSLLGLNIPSRPPTTTSTLQGPLHDAVGLLQQAARQNNSDALYLLADMNFYGNYSHPRDLNTAFVHYDQLASIHGNTTAQFMVGFFYSTAVGNVVERNQAKAMLYYTFAADQGDTRAQMAVGFRRHAAIGTTKQCETACEYYRTAAEKAIKWYRSGPPGGMHWVPESWRITDDNGGAYGRGASASSSGLNAVKVSVHADSNAAIDDVIEYLDLVSQKGDSKASLNLGRIYYDGQRDLEPNLELARKYFFTVAKRYWNRDGRVLENPSVGSDRTAGKAAGYLGRMYLRGEGVAQDFEKAKLWFERGNGLGDAQSQYGLGLMLLHGLGVPKNVGHASKLFRAAAEKDYAPAQIELGVLYLDQGGADDVRVASNYFELAARYGLIEANYYLAELIYRGVGRDRVCGMALQYYKHVAEKAEPLVSSWAAANAAYEEGDVETALLHYLLMAEQGYEKAQNNVAYILDPDQSRLPLPPAVSATLASLGPLSLTSPPPSSPLLENPTMALVYWTRSSRQGNVDSLVKMGDYYFYGLGADRDYGKAVQCYTGAADYSQSAQALFNLGWMHENGAGLTQDYHLAKRYYDLALEVNEEAYLPVTLSLMKLRLRSAWNTLTHGPIHSIQDEPKPKKDWSLAEWITNFIQDDAAYYEDGLYDDIFDDTIGDNREGAPGLEEEGGLELLFILGVSMALVGLLYYRQHRQQQNRREQLEEEQRLRAVAGAGGRQQGPAWDAIVQERERREREQQDRGMFPPPGDPEIANWAVGGVGH